MIKLNLPNVDSPVAQIKETLKIINEIDLVAQKEKELNLDLSSIEWILPCSALLLSAKIDEMKTQGYKISYIEPDNNFVRNYLITIGFPFGTETQGETYYPVNHFNNKDDINKKVGAFVNDINKKLPDKFGDSVLYILGELTDNIEQHSQFTHASIMAQYFPNKEYLDIGILDNGLSIPGVFEKNKIPFSKDCEAVDNALKGTTTKKEEGTRGFGLSSSKKIIRDLIDGELHIISRKGAIIFEPESFSKKYEFDKNSLKGTMIYMRLNIPSKRLNIYPYLE
ncbi:ATP-binding protein [Nanoarchaeota archaeon]